MIKHSKDSGVGWSGLQATTMGLGELQKKLQTSMEHLESLHQRWMDASAWPKIGRSSSKRSAVGWFWDLADTLGCLKAWRMSMVSPKPALASVNDLQTAWPTGSCAGCVGQSMVGLPVQLLSHQHTRGERVGLPPCLEETPGEPNIIPSRRMSPDKSSWKSSDEAAQALPEWTPKTQQRHFHTIRPLPN